MIMKRRIENKLQKFFAPSILFVKDVSHLHHNHLENNPVETHFIITIKSPKLERLSLVKKHRVVQELLIEEFKLTHSISINII